VDDAGRNISPATETAAAAVRIPFQQRSLGDAVPDGSEGRNAVDAAMDRYAAGEDGAFEQVYDLLAPRLRSFFGKRTRDEALADDLVQQTLLNIHKARGRFIPGAPVVPWAFAIAGRLLIDSRRKTKHEGQLPSEAADGGIAEIASAEPGHDRVVFVRQLVERVLLVLANLPANQRIAYELVRVEGKSTAEAAAELGITLSAVKLRAFRAYEALRAEIGEDLDEWKERK
jgi:RNA polymerase sigma-70 factor (ECF subfamily)